ncbi:MAG: glycosyltransferase family 2 protein, partial [Sphingobacteriaceae bacterium]
MTEPNNWPLVSIIITSYNRAQWIKKTVVSALQQDYQNLEIIIADNNSTDNTNEVLQPFLNDSRIIFHKNEVDIGMLPNFKRATNELASGEMVTYISSDDYLVDNSFVSDAVSKFRNEKGLVVYSAVSKNHYFSSGVIEHNSAYKYKKENGLFNRVVSGKEIFKTFERSHVINFGGTVFYREDLVRLDCFRENNTTFADLQTILLLALEGDFFLSDKIAYVQG